MKGGKLKLCIVTSLLSWTLLRYCVYSTSFLGKVLESNTNLNLLGNWPKSNSPAVWRVLIGSFSLLLLVVVCLLMFVLFFSPIVGLQLSIGKLKIVGTASLLGTSWRTLKEGPNKTPYGSILFQAVVGQEPIMHYLFRLSVVHQRMNASRA